VGSRHIVGKYGKDKTKANGIFILDPETMSQTQITFKEMWEDGQAYLLGTERGSKKLTRGNNVFRFEDIRFENDSLILWMEVFQQKFRSKNQTEREIERDYRDFENFITNNDILGDGSGVTGTANPGLTSSATQLIDVQNRESFVNMAVATGYEYVCHQRTSLSTTGYHGITTQRVITPEANSIPTLYNRNIYTSSNKEFVLGLGSDKVSVYRAGATKSKVLYPDQNSDSELGQTRIEHWYNDTYLLRTYFRKNKKDFYALQAIKL